MSCLFIVCLNNVLSNDCLSIGHLVYWSSCLVDYMNSTKLKFNMKKTQFLVVSKKNHNHYKNLKLNYEGTSIEQVREARLLGVYFTWNCSQDYFIRDMPNNLVTWLERRYKMLYKIRNQCEPKVF